MFALPCERHVAVFGTGTRSSHHSLTPARNQDKDKLPPPLQMVELRIDAKAKGEPDSPNTSIDRIAMQTLAITQTPSSTPTISASPLPSAPTFASLSPPLKPNTDVSGKHGSHASFLEAGSEISSIFGLASHQAAESSLLEPTGMLRCTSSLPST